MKARLGLPLLCAALLGWKSLDPIDRLMLSLDAHGLWRNGVFRKIELPESAGALELIGACLGGPVAASAVRAQRAVHAPGEPAPFQAAIVDTAAGEKVVLYRYEGPRTGWWSREFVVPRLALDLEAPQRPYSVSSDGQANAWKGGYRVRYRVVNVSKAEHGFDLWSCSRDRNWRADEPRVSVPAWNCKSDALEPRSLKPGEELFGDIPVRISPELVGQKATFRMAFDPFYKSDGVGPFWSAPITVAVDGQPAAAYWAARFEGLAAGMARVDAEKEIERVRAEKSTYELYAMDTSQTVAYALDPGTILLVTYKPGIPAARAINGHGGQPPQDGTLIEHKVLMLR